MFNVPMAHIGIELVYRLREYARERTMWEKLDRLVTVDAGEARRDVGEEGGRDEGTDDTDDTDEHLAPLSSSHPLPISIAPSLPISIAPSLPPSIAPSLPPSIAPSLTRPLSPALPRWGLGG